MIQRIQSLFLLGVISCSVLLFFTGMASISTSSHSYNFSIWGLIDVSGGINQEISKNWMLMLINIVIVLLSFYVLIGFKNRKLQIRLARFNLLLLLAFLAFSFYFLDSNLQTIKNSEESAEINSEQVKYALGMVLPGIAILFDLLAIYFIHKDEQLVRSADRIR
jgi:Domain of unknown function (DUF4293)